MCFAELSIVTGKSGSQYIYLKEAYGDIPAFLYSWTSSLLMRPGGMALVTLALGTYTADFVVPGDCGVPDVLIKLFAVLVTCKAITNYNLNLICFVRYNLSYPLLINNNKMHYFIFIL